MPIKDAIEKFVWALKEIKLSVVGYNVSLWNIFWYFALAAVLIYAARKFLE